MSKDPVQLTKISIFMSLVLRHKPESIALQFDTDGWAAIDELVAKARDAGVQLSDKIVSKIVLESDKQPFAISTDGQHIRANQGLYRC